MEHENPKIGIIGAGRVGSSFASASFPNGDVIAASSRRPEHREWLSKRSPNIAVVDNAAKVADLADLVFITTSDAAIKPVCDSIPWQPHHRVIHCSGALTLSVLETARNAGAAVAGFHPLQTFPRHANPDRLSNIGYAIDCHDEALTTWLQSASFASASFQNGEVVAASSRRPEHREWLSKRSPNIAVVDNAAKVADLADLVFITTSDAAIKPVCDSIPWQPHHRVIHCSGALTLSVLETARNAGASIAGFHPLQTFPGYGDPDRLSNIGYAIDCHDEALTTWLQSFAHAHDSNTFAIEGETAHAAYHASAVLACGLLAGLVGISAELWQHAGIDRNQALEMLSPMLQSTIDAIARDGLPDAISGPYVRGDLETIRKHLETTAQLNPATSRAYAALALAQIDIANEKGDLDDQTISDIKQALSQHLKSL